MRLLILTGQMLKNKMKKIEYIDTSDSKISSLYNIEQMRHHHTKTLQYTPQKLGITNNKNYVHPQIINDNYILSKLSKQKMYYKSIQSKMVSPKGIAKPQFKRRGSMEITSNSSKCYQAPTRSELEISAERLSNISETNLSD